MKFVSGDSVIFQGIPENDQLEENSGIIIGIANRFPEGNFYIVWLDTPIHDEEFGDYSAIVMTEHCLEKV